MPQQQPQQTLDQKMQDGASWLYLLSNAHAMTLLVFLRTGWGMHAIGMNGFIGMLMILLWAGFNDSPEMMWFFGAWVFAVICRRIQSARAASRGTPEHTRYGGYPYLAMKVPLVRRVPVATDFVEPVLCLLVGSLVCPLSEGLGKFILLGFLSLGIKAGIERTITRRRVRAMRDSEIESRYLAECFRGQRDDF